MTPVHEIIKNKPFKALTDTDCHYCGKDIPLFSNFYYSFKVHKRACSQCHKKGIDGKD
jgi:hypothetical protein